MKKALSLLLALACALSLAACGGASSAAPASKPASGAAPGADAPTELSGTVVYWSMWNESEVQADILKNAIAAFEAANPGVKVEVEWTGREVKNLVSAALESGQQVDVFDSDPAALYTTNPGILMDLTDFYASDALEGGKISDVLMGGLVEWDKGLSKIYSDGKNYSLPYNPYTICWYYNTDMFKDAGITAVPATWEELDAVCQKLKDAGYDPITTDDAYFTMMFQYYVAHIMGEDAIRDMCTKGGDAWNNDAVKQGLEAMESFAKKGYFSSAMKTNAYPAGQQQFAQKKAAMYFNATFMAAENKETAGENFPYGNFAFPAVPNGTAGIGLNTVGGQAFMVNAKTENKDAAYELLRYFTGSACQNEFYSNGLTANLNSVDWPADVAPQKEIVAATETNINWGAGFEGDFWNATVAIDVKAVCLGEMSAADAFADIVAKAA